MEKFDTPERGKFTVLEEVELPEEKAKYGCGFCSYDRKKVKKILEKTKQGFDDSQSNGVPVPQVNLSFFGNKLSLLKFLSRFLFDLVILYPFYFVKTAISMIYLAIFYLVKCKPLMVLKVIVVHTLDLIQALAIVGLIGTIIFYERDLYYEWAITCIILFVSFILLTSYISLTVEAEIESKKSSSVGAQVPMTWTERLEDIFHERHFHNLGLGKFQADYLPEERILGKRSLNRRTITDTKINLHFTDFYELLKEIQRIFKKLNIDPTFLYYSYFYDPPIIETKVSDSFSAEKNAKSKKGFENISVLLKQSIAESDSGPKKAESLRVPAESLLRAPAEGLRAAESLKASSKEESPRGNILLDIQRVKKSHNPSWVSLEDEINPVLFDRNIAAKRKGIALLWKIYSDALSYNKKTKLDQFKDLMVFLLVVGVKIIFPFIYVVGGFDKERVKVFPLLMITDFYIYLLHLLWQILDNDDLRRRSYLLKCLTNMIMFENEKDQFDLNIDITCPVTLETWDNCRRVACAIDQEKTNRYEVVYLFLGVYFIFLFMILAQIWTKTYFLIQENSVYEKPVLLLTMTIDFILILTVFLGRIYNGDLFNQCFLDQIDNMKRLKGIYEDVLQLQDLYFHEEAVIQNTLYFKLVDTVHKRLRRKLLKDIHEQNFHFNKNKNRKFIHDYLRNLINAATKITEQIKVDKGHLSHHFLTMIYSNFKELSSQLVLVALPFIPALINGLVQVFG